MMLYRYFATHVLDTLRDKRLKVARIRDLNDPFECRFAAVGELTRKEIQEMKANRERTIAEQARAKGLSEAKVKQAVRKLRHENLDLREALDKSKKDIVAYQDEILEEDMRVICFSALAPERHDEILMWSHYTNGHRGGRIGFEIPGGNVSAMKYSEKRVAVDLTDLGRPGGYEAMQKAFLDSTVQKSKRWEYEDEYRLFCGPDECQKDGSMEFLAFEPGWVRRVDLGLKFPETEKQEIITLLRSSYPAVKCYQAEFHPTEYALEFEPIA